MSQDDRVNSGRVDRERLPVALSQLLQPLKKPAVDEDPATVTLQQVLRSGHGPGGTEQGQGD
jgi:hypothetical protein